MINFLLYIIMYNLREISEMIYVVGNSYSMV